jgi:phage terminase large subunit-like protein
LTKILDGAADDETYFGVIYTIDETDDWRDPAAWAKANPNYGVSVFPEDIERLCAKALQMPSAQNNFLTKRLSVWVNADAPLFNVAMWEKCGDPVLTLEQFHGEPCWVGLDLAPRRDFCAMALVFRAEGKYVVFAKHYLSEIEVDQCGNSSYPGWAGDGWIITNPGNTTDYDQIEAELLSIQAKFDLQCVCYDPAGAKQILDHMQAQGLPMIEMRPIVNNFSEPTKLLDALIADVRIRHDSNPVLAWELSNVVGHTDRKDNVYPIKERPENKIDGVIALIMALARAMTGSENPKSIYEKRGPQFV